MVQQQGISPDDYSVQPTTVLVNDSANIDMLSLGFTAVYDFIESYFN